MATSSRDRKRLNDQIEAERSVAENVGGTPFGAQCVERGCRLLALPMAAGRRLPLMEGEYQELVVAHAEAAEILAADITAAKDRLATLDAELLDLQAQNAPKVAALRDAHLQAGGALAGHIDSHGEGPFIVPALSDFNPDALQEAVAEGIQALGRIAAIDAERARLFDEAGEVESELRDGQPDDALEDAKDAVAVAHDEVLRAEKACELADDLWRGLREGLSAARANLESMEADAARAAELRTQHAAELHTASVARIFARAMGRDGVPYLLLERAIGPLEAHANRFLAPTDLRMEIEPMRDLASGAQKSEVRINYRNWTGLRPLAASSGHERAVLGAALRVALTSVQAEARGLKVSHVILDEIFNAAHNDRMPECQQMTRLFAETAGRAFVINHNPALNEIADDRIEVGGGVARLVGAPESSNGNGAGRFPLDASNGADVRPAVPAPSTQTEVDA